MSKNDEPITAVSEVQETKAYGIGIDCHSKFIQVSVFARRDMKFYEYRNEFGTDWPSLVHAKEWALDIINSCSLPVPDLTMEGFHYCIESTSTYHMPIVLAWEGTPSIINPTLAGATKRKTDVLDAKLLAHHDLTGLWPQSYIPSTDVKELRVMLSERGRCIRDATSAGSRINNVITRFGLTVGRDGSVVRNSTIRSIVENQTSDEPSHLPGICPVSMPREIRKIIREEYDKYDNNIVRSNELMTRIRNKAISMEWETASSSVSGVDMLRIITSAPQIGDITAITWLAHIITPRRFPSAKALSAYCGLDPSLKVSARHVTSTVKRGGNKELHKALTSAADRLIRIHSEMFGRWGYNIYLQTGKWKKATNAVARKLSVALYYMMLTGQEFSYDSYNLVKDIDVFDIPVSDLPMLNPDFKRYIRILEDNGINTTKKMATAYLACELSAVHGLGRKFFATIRDYLDCQHKYMELYKQLHKKEEPENEP